MNHMRKLFGLALVSILAGGCQSGAGTDPTDDADSSRPPAVPPSATRVEWRQIEQVSTPVSQIRDRRRMVITDRDAWLAFWRDFHGALVPMPEPPEIDFGQNVVIAATMGEKPSGGYAISIRDVFREDGTVMPVIVETSPGPGCANTAVMTAPAVAAVIARGATETRWVEEKRTAACS